MRIIMFINFKYFLTTVDLQDQSQQNVWFFIAVQVR